MDEKNNLEIDEDFEVVEEEAEHNAQAKLKKIRDGLKKCESERKEYLDGWQRAKADHINYRKDEAARFEDMARFVTSSLIQDVLPVLDSFDLAIGNDLPSEVERGVLLIRSQFEDVLKKRGVTEIQTKPGDEFNPEVHESVGEKKADTPAGTVAEVIQKGYLLKENVLRPARVTLSAGP